MPSTSEEDRDVPYDMDELMRIVEEDDMECPICVNEFDIADLNFKPCPCNYRICRFCWHQIKTNMNGLCPACRTPYRDETMSFSPLRLEHLKKLQAAYKQRLKGAANGKPTTSPRRPTTVKGSVPEGPVKKNVIDASRDQKREPITAQTRLRQRTQVYVQGLTWKVANEQAVAALKSRQHFGQYGRIVKLSVTKRTTPGNPPPATATPQTPVNVYVHYRTQQEARLCIKSVDGTVTADGLRLRAVCGSARPCPTYLRTGQRCTNDQCLFAHESQDEESDEADLINVPLDIHPGAGFASFPPGKADSFASLVHDAAVVQQRVRVNEENAVAASAVPPKTASAAPWAAARQQQQQQQQQQPASQSTKQLAHPLPARPPVLTHGKKPSASLFPDIRLEQENLEKARIEKQNAAEMARVAKQQDKAKRTEKARIERQERDKLEKEQEAARLAEAAAAAAAAADDEDSDDEDDDDDAASSATAKHDPAARAALFATFGHDAVLNNRSKKEERKLKKKQDAINQALAAERAAQEAKVLEAKYRSRASAAAANVSSPGTALSSPRDISQELQLPTPPPTAPPSASGAPPTPPSAVPSLESQTQAQSQAQARPPVDPEILRLIQRASSSASSREAGSSSQSPSIVSPQTFSSPGGASLAPPSIASTSLSGTPVSNGSASVNGNGTPMNLGPFAGPFSSPSFGAPGAAAAAASAPFGATPTMPRPSPQAPGLESRSDPFWNFPPKPHAPIDVASTDDTWDFLFNRDRLQPPASRIPSSTMQPPGISPLGTKSFPLQAPSQHISPHHAFSAASQQRPPGTAAPLTSVPPPGIARPPGPPGLSDSLDPSQSLFSFANNGKPAKLPLGVPPSSAAAFPLPPPAPQQQRPASNRDDLVALITSAQFKRPTNPPPSESPQPFPGSFAGPTPAYPPGSFPSSQPIRPPSSENPLGSFLPLPQRRVSDPSADPFGVDLDQKFDRMSLKPVHQQQQQFTYPWRQ